MDIFLSVVITILLSILVLGSLTVFIFFIIEKIMKHKLKKNTSLIDNNSGDVIENKEEDNNKSE